VIHVGQEDPFGERVVDADVARRQPIPADVDLDAEELEARDPHAVKAAFPTQGRTTAFGRTASSGVPSSTTMSWTPLFTSAGSFAMSWSWVASISALR
jgi:hypothetical protein